MGFWDKKIEEGADFAVSFRDIHRFREDTIIELPPHYAFNASEEWDARNTAWKFNLPMVRRKVVFYKEVDGINEKGESVKFKVLLTRVQAREELIKEKSLKGGNNNGTI